MPSAARWAGQSTRQASSSACSTAARAPPCTAPAPRPISCAYQREIRRILESQPGLLLRQETVDDFLVEEGERADRPHPRPSPKGRGERCRLRFRTAHSESPASARQAARSIAPGRRALRRHVHARPASPRRQDRAGRTHRRAGRVGHQPGARPAGLRAAPIQDRHAAADRRPHDRLRQDRTSAGRRRARAVLLSHRSDRLPSKSPAGSPTRIRRSTR